MITTIYGIHNGIGRELNEIVANEHGCLSYKYIFANILFGGIFGILFSRAISRIQIENEIPKTWNLFFKNIFMGTSFGYFAASIAVILTKIVVVISNVSQILMGLSLSSIIRPIMGEGHQLMWATIIFGVLIGIISSKSVSIYLLNQRQLFS